MVNLYYSLIHFYINYGNIAWVSTAKTNLKNLYSQQKPAVRTAFNWNTHTSSNALFTELNALNISTQYFLELDFHI